MEIWIANIIILIYVASHFLENVILSKSVNIAFKWHLINMMAFRKTRNNDGSSYQCSFTKLMGYISLNFFENKLGRGNRLWHDDSWVCITWSSRFMKLIIVISYAIQHASCQICKAIHKSTHIIVQGCVQSYKNIRYASQF